jgi:poly-beta-1,6-N-acetyl-D-glucosamine synthase
MGSPAEYPLPRGTHLHNVPSMPGGHSGRESTYAVITPARDEEANLPRLASSLRAQTLVPVEWIIVDNGSTDSTGDIAAGLAHESAWIQVVVVEAGPPARGGPVVRAFHAGLEALNSTPDVIVKLDADVSMAPDYFEKLLVRFAGDTSLGMASGTALEDRSGYWSERPVTSGHVWGPARAYRWACLQEVMPLEERTGWDGIDEIKASVHGWKTMTFRDLPFRHHRSQGEREGARWRHWRAQGDAAHYMGYRLLYLVLRAIFCARREPAALAMIWGFAVAAVKQRPQLDDPLVRSQLRRHQSFRTLPSRIREALGKVT